MHSPFREILIALVFLFIIVWLITSRKTVAIKKIEDPFSSLLHSALLISGFLIILLNRFQTGFLAIQMIPASLTIQIVGVILSAVGMGLSIWARATLGANWSAKVAIKEGQQLIQNGPYAIVRNPIYTGSLIYIFGAALVCGQVRGLLGLALVLVAVWHKARTEEKFLCEEFGEEYRQYQKRVKFMIPFVI